jgi:phage/plasmid-associated DNA primase
VFVASNDPVRFQSRDTALLNRVKLLNFPHRHWDKEENPDATHVKDPTLEARLRGEGSGILAWIMIGMMEFFRRGKTVVPPAAAEMNRETLRQAGSSVQRWLSDMIEGGLLIKVPEAQREALSRKDFVNRAETWDCYKSWAAGAEERPVTRNTFYTELYEEFPCHSAGTYRCLVGLKPTERWIHAAVAGNGWAAARV